MTTLFLIGVTLHFSYLYTTFFFLAVPVELNLMLKDSRTSCVLISAFVYSVTAHKPNVFLNSYSTTAKLYWI